MSAERGGFLVKRAVRGGGGPRRKKAAPQDADTGDAQAAAATEPATGTSSLQASRAVECSPSIQGRCYYAGAYGKVSMARNLSGLRGNMVSHPFL